MAASLEFAPQARRFVKDELVETDRNALFDRLADVLCDPIGATEEVRGAASKRYTIRKFFFSDFVVFIGFDRERDLVRVAKCRFINDPSEGKKGRDTG